MHCFCFSLILFTSTSLWLMTGVIPMVAASALRRRQGLFVEDDPVTILYGNELKRWLTDGSPGKLMLYYAHWCGHCQAYSPVYKAFAAGITGWQSVLEVGVTNCADPASTDICREFGITGYPTVQMYWIEPGGKGSTSGTLMLSRAPTNMTVELINFLEKKIKEKGAPPGVPDLDPSSETDIKGIWESQPSRVREIFAVVEEPDSYVGREFILDFTQFRQAAMVRFLRGAGPQELRHLDSVSLVSLQRGVHPQVLATERDNEKARKVFKAVLKKRGYEIDGQNHTRTGSTRAPAVKIGNFSQVYLDDIETGIRYTLNQEVAMHKELTPKQLSILKSYLKLIITNVDLPPRISNYLENVVRGIDVSAPLPAAEYAQLLKSAETEDAYLSPTADYNGCKGSIPGKRGYPCTLWTTFHYITVGSHKRFLAKEIKDPNLAMLVIKDYIKTFFSCAECRTHFLNMSANLEEELTNPNESVLWLWRGHNKVNARLKGDASEDPRRPKNPFPPYHLCKSMRIDCLVKNTSVYIESEVLRFLHLFYSKGNLVDSGYHRTTAKRYTDPGNNSKFFSGFDLTIFLVIYAVSITLLFASFVTMVCRRRKGNFNKNFSFLH